MESKVKEIIEVASDDVLADHIVGSFREVERNYFLKSWKTSELDAGHFVESVRRFLELKLIGKYTPIGRSLSNFDAKTMQKYMDAKGNDSYRIHIPRLLLAIYGIRNKRGVGHIAKISPNHLDATFILSSVKWILAELIRINSSHEAGETSKIVERIVDRSMEGVWEDADITRILVEGLSLKEKIVFLLYATSENLESRIFEIIEISNRGYFRKTLKGLHSERLIEYKPNGECILSPKGSAYAEEIILKKVNAQTT